MNGFTFRIYLTIFFLAAGSLGTFAQKFDFLIPEDAIVQHAGSIGYLSIGAGYEVFNNKRGHLDFHYGFVPGSKGGKLNIITGKFSYKPFEIKVKNWAKIYPFNPGIFITYTFHKDLEARFSTDNYPDGYYYWSEAIRPHLAVSNEFQFIDAGILKKAGLKAISLYSEFNTNDYYLINFFQNPAELSFSDIFKLGVGLRLKF
jgi:hypothetical protein